MAAPKAWTLILAALLLFGCERTPAPEEGQGKGPEQPVESITHFGLHTELFVEFPALVKGEPSPFAAHLTRLETFKPVAHGHVTVELSGGGAPEERFEATGALVPGIFRPVVTPLHGGERELTLMVDSESLSDRHALGPVTVFPDTKAAIQAAGKAAPDQGNAITFLKEQQWRTDLATAPVAVRSLRQSITANGVLRARADGGVHITAPVAGRLLSAGEDFPRLGLEVQRDQLLAVIAPRLEGGADAASLELAVSRARLSLEHAERERKRLEGLFRQGAVPEKLVIATRHEEHLARAELTAAARRLEQYRRIQHIQSPGKPAGIAVRSPIAGTVAEVLVAPGEFLEEGQKLFHVVDLDRLWLEVQVSEADIGRIRETRGVWFEIEGFAQPFDVRQETGGRVIALGGVVNPESRTVPLILEFPNLQRALHVGLFARVHVLTEETATGPVIPRSAVVDESGEAVAYVQIEGEAFGRRVLKLGVQDSDLVQVIEGLKPGERVVTRGAYFVHLAASSTALPAHGHPH
jgi:cobalt-zinc-cadmium efflux system membrane fusion protein